MDRRRSSEFVKVYEEFKESNVQSLGHLGLNALYEIATLPEPEREKERCYIAFILSLLMSIRKAI